jgi:hypothetical protein
MSCRWRLPLAYLGNAALLTSPVVASAPKLDRAALRWQSDHCNSPRPYNRGSPAVGVPSSRPQRASNEGACVEARQYQVR